MKIKTTITGLSVHLKSMNRKLKDFEDKLAKMRKLWDSKSQEWKDDPVKSEKLSRDIEILDEELTVFEEEKYKLESIVNNLLKISD